MLKANELRIGNKFIFCDFPEKTIIDITGSIIKEAQNDFKWFNAFFNSIELNEEWLMKFGFIKSNNTEFHTYDKDKLSIHLKSKQYVNGRTYFNSWCIIEKQITYVHQLQNLYFALTGEELRLSH